MRLLLGISLLVLLSACGGDGGAGRADEATPTATTTASPSVPLDTALADAAEELASSLPSDDPSDLFAASDAPEIPTGKADATITANPDDYAVEGEPDECDSIWRSGGTLPSPYQGCAEGDLLVAAEGRQGAGGIFYAYDGLCAGAGERIRRC